jgi:hypothetical protein
MLHFEQGIDIRCQVFDEGRMSLYGVQTGYNGKGMMYLSYLIIHLARGCGWPSLLCGRCTLLWLHTNKGLKTCWEEKTTELHG